MIDTTTVLPMVENTTVDTYGFCSFACPFNNPDDEPGNQPCTYTVRVDTVYKGNTTQVGLGKSKYVHDTPCTLPISRCVPNGIHYHEEYSIPCSQEPA